MIYRIYRFIYNSNTISIIISIIAIAWCIETCSSFIEINDFLEINPFIIIMINGLNAILYSLLFLITTIFVIKAEETITNKRFLTKIIKKYRREMLWGPSKIGELYNFYNVNEIYQQNDATLSKIVVFSRCIDKKWVDNDHYINHLLCWKKIFASDLEPFKKWLELCMLDEMTMNYVVYEKVLNEIVNNMLDNDIKKYQEELYKYHIDNNQPVVIYINDQKVDVLERSTKNLVFQDQILINGEYETNKYMIHTRIEVYEYLYILLFLYRLEKL